MFELLALAFLLGRYVFVFGIKETNSICSFQSVKKNYNPAYGNRYNGATRFALYVLRSFRYSTTRVRYGFYLRIYVEIC